MVFLGTGPYAGIFLHETRKVPSAKLGSVPLWVSLEGRGTGRRPWQEPSVARPVRLMARHGASNAFKAEAAGEQARIWHHLFKALARVGNELFLQVSDCKVCTGFP